MPDDGQLHRDSKTATGNYLRAAVREIDEEFEEGYAKLHPELIAAVMQVAVAEYAASLSSATWAELLPDLVDRLVDAIEHVADGLAAK
jgi:hypothetical protein